MKLSSTEKASSGILKMKETLEAELDALRKNNDKDHDELMTAKIRGKIAQIKQILKTVEDESEVEMAPGYNFSSS